MSIVALKSRFYSSKRCISLNRSAAFCKSIIKIFWMKPKIFYETGNSLLGALLGYMTVRKESIKDVTNFDKSDFCPDKYIHLSQFLLVSEHN